MALSFLEERGHVLLRHNYHTRFGEIDLITISPLAIHCVEVKTWKDPSAVHPLQSLTVRRQNRMRAQARRFLFELDELLNDANLPTRPAELAELAAYRAILAGPAAPPGITRMDEAPVSFDLIHVRETYSCELFPSLF